MNPSVSAASLRTIWPALVILTVLVLLPVGTSSHVPMAIGAVVGIALAWRNRMVLAANAGVRLAALLFACYWLPALVSAPDSAAPGVSWRSVAEFLRFLPFAIFVCFALREASAWSRIDAAIAAVVILWLLDAWVPAFTGHSILGATETERLPGILGAGNLKLGLVFAVLSPFVLTQARQRFGRHGLMFASIFILVPILLAGERAAWLIYALVAATFLWLEVRSALRFVVGSVLAAAIVAMAIIAAMHLSASFASRIERTLLVLEGSSQAIDAASSGRVRIWTTAERMALAHPLNGVGVRAFRYAYAQYAGPNDYFVNPKANDEGAFYAHQIVLEILTETGLIGLLFWIAGAVLALRAWWRASSAARARAFAPGLALVAMTFPLNTHLAFYSAWWGMLFWWLLALYCAALFANEAEPAHVA